MKGGKNYKEISNCMSCNKILCSKWGRQSIISVLNHMPENICNTLLLYSLTQSVNEHSTPQLAAYIYSQFAFFCVIDSLGQRNWTFICLCALLKFLTRKFLRKWRLRWWEVHCTDVFFCSSRSGDFCGYWCSHYMQKNL